MTNVSIDVETSKKPFFLPWQPEAFLVCVSTCDEENNTRTWFFEHEAATQTPRQSIEEIQEYLNQFDRVIAHNLKFDYHWLRHIGIDLESRKLWCTQVVEYLVRRHGNIQDLSLAELSTHYGIPPKKDQVQIYWEAEIDTNDIPAEILQTYCEQDAVNAMLIFKHQTQAVQEMGLLPLLSLEMEVIRCYEEMEWNGMKVDLDQCAQESEVVGAELEEIDFELTQLLGIDNPGSDQQLSLGLFGGKMKQDAREEVQDEDGNVVRYKTGDKAGQVKTRKITIEVPIEGIGFDPKKFGIPETATPGIYSVSKDKSLPLLKAKTKEQKRVLELLYLRSEKDKLKSGYYDSLPEKAVRGAVHSNINQALTKTGRLSSSQPNLQNLPRGDSPVKKLFITRY